MSGPHINVIKHSLGTMFYAGGVTIAKVTFNSDVLLWVHEDCFKWTACDAGATSIAEFFTDYNSVRL
jgi:hypothetical protein